ncbi:MAG TPA: O-antigen ligase family protein [Rhizomicrobium sp.]|nr:O-antigen ligase family protein [Rhizomicrobium sp.]
MTAARSLSQSPPGRLESFYIFVSLLLVTQALGPLLMAGTSSEDALGDSNPATLLSALLVYTIALALLARRPGAVTETIQDNPLLIAIFALPVVSVIWSVDHGTSFRRAVALVMTGLYCVYLARRLSPDDFLRRLLLALFAGGVCSLIFTVIDPQHAIEHGAVNNGSWKGVYGHKAILGRIAAVAVTVSIYVRPRFAWERAVRWATIAIFLFLAVQSQSRASWLMMGGGVCFMVLIAVMRNRRFSSGIKLSAAFAVGLAAAAAGAVLFEQILAAFGRDDTFSGRTSLWEGAVAVASANHPVLGAGYRAFWTAAGAEGVRDYVQHWARLPYHGHNGYLDIWLELGYAGLALFALFVVVSIGRLIRRLLRESDEPAWAAFAIFFFVFLLNNASVTVAFKHTDIAWIFAVLACLYTRGCVNARLPVLARAERRRLGLVFPNPIPHWRPVRAGLQEAR